MTTSEHSTGETIYIERLEGADIEVPEIEWPAGLPLSERLTYSNQVLLQANGYADTTDEWHRAATSTTDVFREAAYQILAHRTPRPEDAPLFRCGLDDESEIVQVWSAWGLLQLGDPSQRSKLEASAALELEFGWHAPLVAASLLGELGAAAAWSRIEHSWETSPERPVLISYAWPFVNLHGQEYAPGYFIDIWAFYRRALGDSDAQVRYAALDQLAVLKPPQAKPLLEEFISGATNRPYQIEMAKRILSELP